jgi:hypothetical protein
MLAVMKTTNSFSNSLSSATHFCINNRLEPSTVMSTEDYVFKINIVINII